MTVPKFTILTATFNCEKYVAQCIESILKQDYVNWEMFILDDLSTDRTFEIIESFKDSRIVVQQNNRKLYCGSTYAKLLSLATGEYCGVVDGDDLLMPSAIRTVVDYYRRYPQIDFIWTKHRWCNGELTRSKPGISTKPRAASLYDSEKGFRHVYSHWRTFKTCLREKAVLFKDMPCTVDKELGYTLEEIGRGGFLSKELYCYRYHRENMSHNSRQKEAWHRVRKSHKNKHRKGVVVLK